MILWCLIFAPTGAALIFMLAITACQIYNGSLEE